MFKSPQKSQQGEKKAKRRLSFFAQEKEQKFSVNYSYKNSTNSRAS